ncbi:MAG: DUF547 domain-containing protein [Winogradskyella sp.]
MKYVSILIIVLFTASCSNTKKAIEAQPAPVREVATVTDVQDLVEIPSVLDTPNSDKTNVPEPPKPPKLEEAKITDHYYPEKFNHNRWNTLLSKNVTKNGNVDYKAFKNNPLELQVYIDNLTHRLPTEDWDKNDKLAYWINAYNALTIDLIIRNYPTKSIKDIKDPWDQRLWKFGSKWQNLNDIEHKILRNMNEPRIHFAIVCASVSCPKLQNEAFTALNIEAQLVKATNEFLNDTSKNKLSEDRIQLSKLFKWFKKDFENSGSLIDFLNLYTDIKISSKAKKSFMDYNWNLND